LVGAACPAMLRVKSAAIVLPCPIQRKIDLIICILNFAHPTVCEFRRAQKFPPKMGKFHHLTVLKILPLGLRFLLG
jgi:hypothetical protein